MRQALRGLAAALILMAGIVWLSGGIAGAGAMEAREPDAVPAFILATVIWGASAVPFLWGTKSGRETGRRVLLWQGGAGGAALLLYATRSAGLDIDQIELDFIRLTVPFGYAWVMQALAAPLLFGADACLRVARES